MKRYEPVNLNNGESEGGIIIAPRKHAKDGSWVCRRSPLNSHFHHSLLGGGADATSSRLHHYCPHHSRQHTHLARYSNDCGRIRNTKPIFPIRNIQIRRTTPLTLR